MPYPLCICVGDSITQLGWRPDGGYVAALAHEVKDYAIDNLGAYRLL